MLGNKGASCRVYYLLLSLMLLDSDLSVVTDANVQNIPDQFCFKLLPGTRNVGRTSIVLRFFPIPLHLAWNRHTKRFIPSKYYVWF